LMVVWDYPCESKSSPAHYSKHPNLKRGWGVFLYGKSIRKELLQRIIDTKRIRQNKNPIVFKK
ncbi:hypothetical protein AB0T07_15530, partial [Acinetobacter baumannii]|uniref:hypothetical protein n=1 Tax=Acinetobacter baumannii TaxID=470 RepID=UPI00344E60DD